jgi:hypothetical protein
MDLQVNAGGFEIEFPELAGQMPSVTTAPPARSSWPAPLSPDGRPDTSFGGRARPVSTASTSPTIVSPSPSDGCPTPARAEDVALGQRFDIGVFDPAVENQIYSDSPPAPVDRLEVTVVGIGVFPRRGAAGRHRSHPTFLFTPVSSAREQGYASYAWTAVKLRGCQSGVDRFKPLGFQVGQCTVIV